VNCGIAIAARIPMIAMTIISSISVKPFSFLFGSVITILFPPPVELNVLSGNQTPPAASLVHLLHQKAEKLSGMIYTNGMPKRIPASAIYFTLQAVDFRILFLNPKITMLDV
jgi:hypothetical protein